MLSRAGNGHVPGRQTQGATMSHRWSLFPIALFAVCLSLSGCGGTSTPVTPPTNTDGSGDAASTGTKTDDAATKTASDEPKPFKLGDLIEPFTPPKLEELDQTAEWQDRPVRDSMKLLRDKLAQEKPLVTVEQALAMKNN